jgi:hypothetical protein
MIKLSEKGMMLVTILMLTFLLVMLTTSMILISSQNLNMTGLAEKKAKALQAAEAGVDYAFYRLNNDSTWGTGVILDTPQENLGSNQSFTIVFNPFSSHHSKNNLMNKDPNGSTPGYSAEIISKGTYKGTEKVLRAIFVREDEFLCPIYTEGDIFMRSYITGTLNFNVTGKKSSNDPGRIHSNTDIDIKSTWGTNIAMNLHGGFLSACSTVTLADMTASVNKKTDVLPVKIPDINITDIIANRPSDPNMCKTLDPNTFYLAGYFEYDPNSPYCIPHHPRPGDSWAFIDPNVYTSNYKVGIASFTETDCTNFLSNYQAFYTPSSPPLNPGRNFYNYYNPITFYEYPISGTTTDIANFNNNLKNSLGLSMTVDTEPVTGKPRITLNLEKDIYIPDSTGLFETTTMSGNRPVYLWPAKSARLNFNGHKIYTGSKLWIGMPLYGTGAIISGESVDFIQGGYNANLVILSEKSVRMLYREEPCSTVIDLPYTGIIYAKDDILIESNSQWSAGNKNLIIKGTIVCKNNQPTVFDNSLLTTYPLSFYSSLYRKDLNFYIDSVTINNINIIHSADGLDNLAALRGNDFNVRKLLCEVLK